MKPLSLILVLVLILDYSQKGTECATVEQLEEQLQDMQQKIAGLGHQLLSQQLFALERARTDGGSGIKMQRAITAGTRPYFGDTWTGRGAPAAIHEHANNDRTIGMGELNAVLNGVDFKTRHNDYRLKMPSTTTTNFHQTEDIPFPEVPPAVLEKLTADDQIAEMREWFKAWKDQDYSVRDYRPYFKAVLCYLEGAWMANTNEIDEPFFSDRHNLEAKDWHDLLKKINFINYVATKNIRENLAFLPTSIMEMVNGTARYAQWNYRILCHPISRDLPTNAFEVVDDMHVRMRRKWNMTQLKESRLARFTLSSIMPHNRNAKFVHRQHLWALLDDLMYEIPGKGNYPENMPNDTYQIDATHPVSGEPLNLARYNRFLKVSQFDAMGSQYIGRAFGESNLFASASNQPKISPSKVRNCEWKWVNGERYEECTDLIARYSYAIPLEVIYLTPLYTWNPYDLRHNGNWWTPEGQVSVADGRNGGFTPETAYNGTNSNLWYRTPGAFFQSDSLGEDTADTTRWSLGFLDKQGNVRNMRASGTYIFLPEIEGVGHLRTRYLIFPTHAEGSPVYRELDALKAMIKDNQLNTNPSENYGKEDEEKQEETHELQTLDSKKYTPHSHPIYLSETEFAIVTHGGKVNVTAEIVNGHMHTFTIKYKKKKDQFRYVLCDGAKKCRDEHPKTLVKIG